MAKNPHPRPLPPVTCGRHLHHFSFPVIAISQFGDGVRQDQRQFYTLAVNEAEVLLGTRDKTGREAAVGPNQTVAVAVFVVFVAAVLLVTAVIVAVASANVILSMQYCCSWFACHR